MPFDHQANIYWGLVETPPDPPLTGETLVIVPGHARDFPPSPFTGVLAPPGKVPVLEECEIVRVLAQTDGTMTMERAPGVPTRQAVAPDWRLQTSIVETGPA